jgi:8-oxo-dGTP pyrophosphatase MutT (NUDIX family)
MDTDPRRPHLRALLDAYRPVDDGERGHLERMRVLLDSDSDPFTRDRFEPGHFTASAFVLAPDDDALFFIHHRKLQRWLQPGGHVEPSDADIFFAAQREVAEEVGLQDAHLVDGFEGVFDVDVHPIPARKDEPAHAHFDVRFLFRAPARDAVAATDETLGGRWMPLAEITAASTEPSIARAVRKLDRS